MSIFLRYHYIMQLLLIDYIKENLKTAGFGQNLYYFEKLGSTSDQLKELAESNAPEGTIVIAEEQKTGRGRSGNLWYSPPGAGLYFSLLLRPCASSIKLQGLTLALGCSAARTLEGAAGMPVEIKWPNDIYCKGRKLGGILTESKLRASLVDTVVVGMGLNLNNQMLPLELCETATSLELESGKHIFREGLLTDLLTNLERDYLRFKEHGFSTFAEELRPRFFLNQKWVMVSSDDGQYQKGVVTGFDAQGALLLLDGEGRNRCCSSGTVAEIGQE
ncbi:biotin--[acetyl-CoA-carboxylase] ligase [candidate division TA06 bacterium]|uniref:Biotin--[acetyl-CoA-carboxylase] ligase n=1 Tax=candidate division TA06 bacterium TaxID=2250710 RepID=A0A933MKA5_UNCT6|nr:biotin--[acetyl-CoA-carboxylase] ligase [candidate division TA06 bacterium]